MNPMSPAVMAMFLLAGPVELPPAPVPTDAVFIALADVQQCAEATQPFVRYVWVPEFAGDPVLASYVSNLVVSKSDQIVQPTYINGGRLVRLDLSRLCPSQADLVKAVQLWETLANDEPYFHVTITKTVVIAPAQAAVAAVGKNPGRAAVAEQTRTDKLSAMAGHLNLAQAVQLQGMTKTAIPVVRADWLYVKLLTTLNGGRYYDFAGIDRNPRQGTAQAAFLASVGANETLSEQLRSILSAAMFKSLVTAKPRRVDFLHGAGGLNSTGFVAITHDTRDGPLAAAKHPILSLLGFQDEAREIIAEKNNGLLMFGLFNNQGALQDSVPDDIAKDHGIPAPYTARLEPGIGCIRCHGVDGSDGWKPVHNDVPALLSVVRAFDDAGAGRKTSRAATDLIESRYQGDTKKPLRRARDDYADAIHIATGGLNPQEVASGLADIFTFYRYSEVGPRQALMEVGFMAPTDAVAAAWFTARLQARPLDQPGGETEDVRILALKRGISIPRSDWEAVYADVRLRAIIAAEGGPPKQEPKK